MSPESRELLRNVIRVTRLDGMSGLVAALSEHDAATTHMTAASQPILRHESHCRHGFGNRSEILYLPRRAMCLTLLDPLDRAEKTSSTDCQALQPKGDGRGDTRPTPLSPAGDDRWRLSLPHVLHNCGERRHLDCIGPRGDVSIAAAVAASVLECQLATLPHNPASSSLREGCSTQIQCEPPATLTQGKPEENGGAEHCRDASPPARPPAASTAVRKQSASHKASLLDLRWRPGGGGGGGDGSGGGDGGGDGGGSGSTNAYRLTP